MANFFKRLFGYDEPEKKTNVEEETQIGTQSIDGHEYIDLGFPSGIVWSACNIGAKRPEEHGLHLQWGNAILPKVLNPDYSRGNMPHSNNGSLTKYNTQSQYGFVDNRVVLDFPDDAASANWSSRWHIPTKENFKELINNCKWEWKQQNGVNGFLVTSKINGNSLFLPTTGLSAAKSIKKAETMGFYWTSSLNVKDPSGAWGVDFLENQQNLDACVPRFIGMAIRPVSSKLDYDTILRAIEKAYDKTGQPQAYSLMDYVKMLDGVVSDYCQRAYNGRPSFHIGLSTNFLHSFNFDGLDMVEIQMDFEKLTSLNIPEDHPFNKRLADDTDYSVAYFLSAHGLF